jgi:hypothetical protein
MEKPGVSEGASTVVWARVAGGTTKTSSAETTTATASGRPAGGLRIAALQLRMEDRQRRAHEVRHLPLRRDATGVERAGERWLPERQQLVHVADVLELQR